MTDSHTLLIRHTLNCCLREAWERWTNASWLHRFLGDTPVSAVEIKCPFEIYTETGSTAFIRLLPGKLIALRTPLLQTDLQSQLVVTFLQDSENQTTVELYHVAPDELGKNGRYPENRIHFLRRFSDWVNYCFRETL